MRIIFSNYDSLDNPYYGGGGAIAIHEIAKRLVIDNWDVKVVTGRYPGSINEKVDGVSYERIGMASLPPRLAQLFFQFQLVYFLRKQNFDIWVESFTPPFSTAFLPLFTRKPIIGLTHLLSGKEMSKKYHLPFFLIENFGLSFYKNCIVLTDSLKASIHNISPKMDIVVIPNGIEDSLFQENSDTKKNHILFLGRLDIYQKGLDILLKAYKKLPPDSPKLVLAGTGNEKDVIQLKQNIKNLGLEERIILKGKVKGGEKNKLLSSAYFLVAPSRFESFGIVIAEAFACGVPVICTSIEGFEWVPSLPADKVRVGDYEELSVKMNLLLNDAHQRNIMGVAGRDYVKGWSWDNISTRYSDYIKKVYENTSHTSSINK